MKRRKRFIPFRRKLEGRTDYRKRLAMLKSGKLRLVIRRSLNNISAQLIGYENAGDRVFVSAHSRELLQLGWKGGRKNMPAAYLVGLLCGTKAKQGKITEAILDTGFYTAVKGSVIYSVLKGALDAGLKVPHDASVLPKEDRIKGKHIKNANLETEFEAVKKKILGGAK